MFPQLILLPQPGVPAYPRDYDSRHDEAAAPHGFCLPKHDGDKRVQTRGGDKQSLPFLQAREQPEPPALPVGLAAALPPALFLPVPVQRAQEFLRVQEFLRAQILRVQVLRAQEFLHAQVLRVQEFLRVQVLRAQEFLRVQVLRAQEFLQAQVQRALPVQHQLRLPPHAILPAAN